MRNPKPLIPGQPAEVAFNMNEIAHSFKKGHRIMVQLQSSWFPLVDLNPQTFVNIPTAGESDFQKATIRIWHDAAHPPGSRCRLCSKQPIRISIMKHSRLLYHTGSAIPPSHLASASIRTTHRRHHPRARQHPMAARAIHSQREHRNCRGPIRQAQCQILQRLPSRNSTACICKVTTNSPGNNYIALTGHYHTQPLPEGRYHLDVNSDNHIQITPHQTPASSTASRP